MILKRGVLHRSSALAALVAAVFSWGCAHPQQPVDALAYHRAMDPLLQQLSQGHTRCTWPYGNDATMACYDGKRGDPNMPASFYTRLDRMNATIVYLLFVTGRRRAGFSAADARKCTVIILDDYGHPVASADETTVSSQ